MSFQSKTNGLMHLLRAQSRRDANPAPFCSQLPESIGHPGEESLSLRLNSVFSPLLPSGHARFKGQIEPKRDIWHESSRGNPLQVEDQGPIQTPPIALISQG